ncbi:LacI family DNA-binding transcriptional regulator [Pseudonocardia oroxyli]|uniref:Transcriptional regulator, LacI family n=1 Tax=Pseudonocardia oroxyli TaxID=366584 RepID=A0A1G7STT4_PSEOR|nr:LacI family DNA-binding transcriptional regulator [Pseudonocardia oroxyli]SDG26536.1 transcriptional regulator, LacI family [Pseudonocardia oroxyli]
MATIRDVARAAGVSVATVSHALNGTRYVSPQTMERVRSAVDAVGYVNDALARSLRRGQSDAIGLVTSALRNPMFYGAQRRIDASLHERGFTTLLVDHDDQHERELQGLRRLISWRVGGIILQPSLDPEGALRWLSERDLPVVLVDRKPPAELQDRYDFAGTENTEGAVALVDHLVEHGHRRIAMICSELSSSTMAERLAGYRAALRHAGLPLDPDMVREVPAHTDAAAGAARELMSAVQPPSAIFAGNDLTCLGTLQGLRASGLSVPHDVALVTFDDIPWVAGFEPSLTCARQQVDEIAEAAAELLVTRLEPGGRDQPVRRRVLSTEFVRRESCGCPG